MKQTDRSSSHVPAYLEFSGQQVGLAGVGSGLTFGLVPKSWTAGQLIWTQHWIKILGLPNCEPLLGTHYEPIPSWRPRQVTFHKYDGRSMTAVDSDSAASCSADWITLSNYQVPIEVLPVQVPGEVVPQPAQEPQQVDVRPPTEEENADETTDFETVNEPQWWLDRGW